MLELPQIMLSNLYQLDRYVDEYCQQNPMEWCEVQLLEFHAKLDKFETQVSELVLSSKADSALSKAQQEERDAKILDAVLEMRRFANDKYRVF